MTQGPYTIGIATFTDPRDTAFAGEREAYLRERHGELARFLAGQGFRVADPMAALGKENAPLFGLRSTREVEAAAAHLRREGAQCLVIGCWHWTEPQLPLSLVRELDLPVLLYTEDDPRWAGAVHLSATGASLWEVGVNDHALTHWRVIGKREEIVPWARGVCALQALRRSTLLLWGGSYCLRMEHLQDDVPTLKSFLVGDIWTEDAYALIKRADALLAEGSARIERFIAWLEKGGVRITRDEKMLTEKSARTQVALYLAARDRLRELADEPIAGVSVRCQPELSEDYACTGCLLPSFLPFAEDSEGKQPVVPTVCEGDIKGLITCALLGLIEPGTPPLFGDLKYMGPEYIIISNCGGSSVYYAALSNEAKQALPRVTWGPQCQGAAGGAIGYCGAPGPLTVARLVRIEGEYLMQLGLMRAREITPEITEKIIWGQTWPHIAIEHGVDRDLLARAVGSNHYCALPGDHIAELQHACREAGLEVLRLDSNDELADFVANL